MSYHQSRIIDQAKFTYSPLGKDFEKQTETIEEQGKKQIKAIDDHASEGNNKQLENKQLDNKKLDNNK